MSDVTDLRHDLEAARDQFEQYRASVVTTLEERPAGELSRALDTIIPDLVFYEGQAFAAGLGLARLNAGGGPAGVARELERGLVEQQAARRSCDYLAGIARILTRSHQDVPDQRPELTPDGR